MDEQSIQSIVKSVLRELGETNLPEGRIMTIKPDETDSAPAALSAEKVIPMRTHKQRQTGKRGWKT